MRYTIDEMLDELADGAGKPPLETPGEPFWDDPHISRQLLRSHLDPTVNLASRKPPIIEATVDWLVEKVGLEPGDSVLDLGCGPGLYCRQFFEKGLRVTGLDLSEVSIEYAREDFRETYGVDPSDGSPTVQYIRGNYLDFPLPRKHFDLVVLIFYDFGVLGAEERHVLLDKIYRALKPGGHYAFDVLTEEGRRSNVESEERTWSLESGGFWSPHTHLVLSEHFEYPEDDTFLDQYLVVDKSGVKTYRFWPTVFTPQSISALLTSHGFEVDAVYSDLRGSEIQEGREGLGVIARKPVDL